MAWVFFISQFFLLYFSRTQLLFVSSIHCFFAVENFLSTLRIILKNGTKIMNCEGGWVGGGEESDRRIFEIIHIFSGWATSLLVSTIALSLALTSYEKPQLSMSIVNQESSHWCRLPLPNMNWFKTWVTGNFMRNQLISALW